MNVVSSVRLGSEFADFLYAPIGPDRNGMPLSMLSALARQDVDPWEEAAKLTQLPEQEAVSQLVSLLGAFPHAMLACPDPATLATRLIALLPRRGDHVLPGLNLFDQADPAKHSEVVSSLSFALIFMVLTLFSIWLIGSPQTSGQLPVHSAPESTAISQPSPPSNE
jgi:hypothetical protein